jgi:hypothetical protein
VKSSKVKNASMTDVSSYQVEDQGVYRRHHWKNYAGFSEAEDNQPVTPPNA